MSLMYYPRPGEILLCNYDTGFVAPEMTKLRPVVVVSPRLRKRGELVGVVPLSTTEPDQLEDHHCRIEMAKPLSQNYPSLIMWAKCDMLATVARSRLDRFKAGRVDGSRIYVSGHLDIDQLKAVRASILYGLGLGSLTIHL
ncbi:MAG: type II toxin-antitoxin system PemK/MazF family toxin [Sphingobium sp.]|nr:type II toxin-antitoxin system PemK/MazF family toxin [Sphingobium sp.]